MLRLVKSILVSIFDETDWSPLNRASRRLSNIHNSLLSISYIIRPASGEDVFHRDGLPIHMGGPSLFAKCRRVSHLCPMMEVSCLLVVLSDIGLG